MINPLQITAITFVTFACILGAIELFNNEYYSYSSNSTTFKSTKTTSKSTFKSDKLLKLIEFGFDLKESENALISCNYDLEAAIEYLIFSPLEKIQQEKEKLRQKILELEKYELYLSDLSSGHTLPEITVLNPEITPGITVPPSENSTSQITVLNPESNPQITPEITESVDKFKVVENEETFELVQEQEAIEILDMHEIQHIAESDVSSLKSVYLDDDFVLCDPPEGWDC